MVAEKNRGRGGVDGTVVDVGLTMMGAYCYTRNFAEQQQNVQCVVMFMAYCVVF